MKHWDLPFSVWISELEKELFSAHPVTLEEELIFGMSSHHELSATQQLRTFNIELEAQVKTSGVI